jgi:diadenosine tetraphosphate (Ap4A) HIT family hydrolase
MRAAVVPRPLSLAASNLLHAVVFPSPGAVIHPPRGSGRAFSRFEDLPAELLSDALRRCREVMSPKRSFTIACSGETAGSSGGSGSSESNDAAEDEKKPVSSTTNADRVILHAVERQAGDYVPNNLLYHTIQMKFDPSAAPPSSLRDDINTTPSPWSWFHDARMQPNSSSTADATIDRHSNVNNAFELTRPRVPAHLDSTHQRAELEHHNQALTISYPSAQPLSDLFHFYPYTNKAACVVYATQHFVVLENLKPVVDGHLLVVPRRIIGSIHDFSDEEVSDWGNILRVTVDALSKMYPYAKKDGFSIAIQSGRDAGQTVWHQHTHVIPYRCDSRLAGEPEEGDEEEQARRQPRTEADMIESAAATRAYFYGGECRSAL